MVVVIIIGGSGVIVGVGVGYGGMLPTYFIFICIPSFGFI
jgi:hypothetical protein